MPSKPLPFLEDIELPGHSERPDMDIGGREWIVHPRNRAAVARLWALLQEAPRTVCGVYGFLTSDQLDDVGVPEWLISHWRLIDYTDAGERVETIPGGMVARDLDRLGLGRDDVEQGTVVPPRPRPAPVKTATAIPATVRSNRPAEPVVIRRRETGVARGA